MAQSGYGEIRLFNDFTGPEIQANSAVEHASATGAMWSIFHPYTIKGQNLDQSASGGAAVEDGLNGQVLLSTGAAAEHDACYMTTETCFKPSVNAPMAVECRLEMAALTLRRVFVGFSGTVADAQASICEGNTTTITLTETNQVGFLYDSGLTTDIEWHFVHAGGTVTGVTDATLLNSGVTPVVDTMDILRVEVDNNGTARWFINGVLLKTLAGAIAPTAVFAGCVGVLCTVTTSGTVSVDYLAVEANRDWTV